MGPTSDVTAMNHMIRKDRKHMFENMLFYAVQIWLGSYVVVITSIGFPQEIFAIDMLRTLKSPLEHRDKHVLRWLRLYGDQALKIYIKLGSGAYQAIPGNNQNASPTNQKTAGSKLDRTS